MKQITVTMLAISLLLLSGCAAPATALPEPTATRAPPTEAPPEPTATSVPPTEAPVTPTHLDVPYIDDGDPNHLLDIYLPEGASGPLPTLFVVHGADTTKEDHNALAGYFVERGYAAVLIDYGDQRLSTKPARPVTYQDAFCALAWVHANADTYGFDPERVAVFGDNFGSTQAAMLATVDDPSQFMEGCPHPLPESGWIRGVATYSGMFLTGTQGGVQSSGVGPYLASMYEVPFMEMIELLAELREVPPTNWRDASELSADARSLAKRLPPYWIDGSEPPFLLIHGADPEDNVMPPAESESFAAHLQAAGVEVELLLIPGARLGSSTYSTTNRPYFIQIVEAMEAFMEGLFAE